MVSLMWIFICIFARKIFNYMPMDNRNTVQLNSLVGWLRLPPSRLGHSSELDGSRCSVGCLGNSSATDLKNQMKERIVNVKLKDISTWATGHLSKNWVTERIKTLRKVS